MSDLVKTQDQDRVPARIEYHPKLGTHYGVDAVKWKALCEVVYPDADIKTLATLLSICKSRALDPLRKLFHVVPVWDSKSRGYVSGIWPSIDLYRTEAARSGTYAGMDEPNYGPDQTSSFQGMEGKGQDRKSVEIELIYPAWVQITVYRIVAGTRCAFHSPKIRFLEFYRKAGRAGTLPNDKWRDQPAHMLEKVAEAHALRRAFPEVSGEPTAEEMETVSEVTPVMKDITPMSDYDAAPGTQRTDTSMESQAKAEGYHAFATGLTPSDCPYESDTEQWREWNTGYLEAERQKEAMTEEQEGTKDNAEG